jgi:hypothetical protein
MSLHVVLKALRYLALILLVVLMAGASSGMLPPDSWSNLVLADAALARIVPSVPPSERFVGTVADNGPVCAPRPGPLVQTSQDARGSLLATISAATDPQGFPVRLREIRVGPMQNAAVDGGTFVARTTPFVISLPGGSNQSNLRVTRIMAGQTSHVTLVVVDDCGDWVTFIGGGTGVSIAPPAATATSIPVAPGQPFGSIPISVTVSGSNTQYPPESRPRVEIRTRPRATCNLSISWPNGRVDAFPTIAADALGSCQYRPTVPGNMQAGTATATGTAHDLFGLNLQQMPFRIGGSLGTIPPGDNILGSIDDPTDNADAAEREDNEPENEDGQGE